MTAEPSHMPGGYETGTAALQDLVRLSALLGAARLCKSRLVHALADIDRMITQTDAQRSNALRAVERFADEQPSTLGVGSLDSMQFALDVVDCNLSTLERDVADIVRKAGGV